jgi:condensin complex subunit 3
MRDTEPTIRKVVISGVLEPNTTQGDDFKIMGPTHPRAFTISQREQIVKDGLGDREEAVRRMASNLIGTWIDVINVSGAKTESQEVKQEKVPNVEEGVLSLLTLFDLGQDTIAVDALSRVFTWRPDIFNNIVFGGMLC